MVFVREALVMALLGRLIHFSQKRFVTFAKESTFGFTKVLVIKFRQGHLKLKQVAKSTGTSGHKAPRVSSGLASYSQHFIFFITYEWAQ